MRTFPIELNEYYHIYNRGNNKQPIFLENADFIRFLFLILHFQADVYLDKISRHVKLFGQHRGLVIPPAQVEKKRYVRLVSFALMPNHFHLLVHEYVEGGIARYMLRVLDAYTKYFNIKYKSSGHVFQGPYQAKCIHTNELLLHVSAYIHRNPRGLTLWKDKEDAYPWSRLSGLYKRKSLGCTAYPGHAA